MLAIRARVFDVRKLPDTLRYWATDVLGLGIVAGSTGLQLHIGDIDAGSVLVAAFWAPAFSLAAKLIAKYEI
jgi:hypothetical protein